MTPDERDAFLDRPFCAILASLTAGGSPHPVPVWFRWNGEAFLVWSGEDRFWMKNIGRDPRVALAIHEHESPYRAVLARGRAQIRSDRSDATFAEVELIVRRYVREEDEVDAKIAEFDEGSPQSIVTIVPTWLRAWSVPP